MSNMRQIGIMVLSYEAEEGHWPESMVDAFRWAEYDQELIDGLLANPREEFETYYYEPPSIPSQEIEDPAAVPMVWEVCEHGGVVRDGCVVYADGHGVFAGRVDSSY